MNVVEEILRAKRAEVEMRKQEEPLDALRERVAGAVEKPCCDFAGVLSRGGGRVRLIAEIKRRSPSRGRLSDLPVEYFARVYEGSPVVDAVSVLTDRYFEGRLEHVGLVRSIMTKPLLRKDFIIDVYQVYEARLAGADAVLLIATLLEGDILAQLLDEVHSLGMEALVECHRPEDFDKLPPSVAVVGINNRDLLSPDLRVDTGTVFRLLERVPSGCITVCESGVSSVDDVVRLNGERRIDALLVGTFLVSGDTERKLVELGDRLLAG